MPQIIICADVLLMAVCKEYVAVSIYVYPWQGPMQRVVKLHVTHYARVKLLDNEEIITIKPNCTIVPV